MGDRVVEEEVRGLEAAAGEVAEDDFQGPPCPLERALSIAIPLLAVVAMLVVGPLIDPKRTGEFLLHAATSVLVAGKFIVLGSGVPGSTMRPWELAGLVILMDTLTGTLWVYNMDLLFRIPRLGPWFRRTRDRTRRLVSRSPWLRRQAFLGVVLVVMFPITGTGAIAGSILGRLAGLRRGTNLVAIVVGAIVGSGAIAALVQVVGVERTRELLDQPVLLAVVLVVLLGGSFLLAHRLQRED